MAIAAAFDKIELIERVIEQDSTMTLANLDDLAAFAAVARERSFTRAAALIGTSTSNLSHTISKLERRLSTRLLQRNSRSVSTTEAGEDLLKMLSPALESIEVGLKQLDKARTGVSGTLRITTTRQAYASVIQPILPAFTARHPHAVVEIITEYAYRNVVTDRFDAGIRLGEKLEKDMIALKVGPELRMAVVASPAYLKNAGTIDHPRDLTRQRCLNYRMLTSGTIYAWEFERAGQELNVQVSGPVTFCDPELMLEASVDGLGIAYLLDHEVASFVANGRLVRLLDDWTPPFPGFHLYYPSRRHMRPILTAFIQALRDR
jgi:DNA-binding transcriptional LysR family regulator